MVNDNNRCLANCKPADLEVFNSKLMKILAKQNGRVSIWLYAHLFIDIFYRHNFIVMSFYKINIL